MTSGAAGGFKMDENITTEYARADKMSHTAIEFCYLRITYEALVQMLVVMISDIGFRYIFHLTSEHGQTPHGDDGRRLTTFAQILFHSKKDVATNTTNAVPTVSTLRQQVLTLLHDLTAIFFAL